MLCTVNHKQIDQLDINALAKDFIAANDRCHSYFGFYFAPRAAGPRGEAHFR